MIDHELVPNHEILSPEEAQKVMEKYNATLDQFPKIFAEDPALKDMQAKAGDLIRITRVSQEIGTSFYYRVVIQ